MRTPDGAVWTHGGLTYQVWTRYLSGFDSVRVVARVLDVPAPPDGARRVDGAGVEVWPLPYYLGPRQYLQRWPALRQAVCAAAGKKDAVILRAPSAIGSLLAASRDRHRLPYALEVIADPHDVFAPGVLSHPLRPLLRQRYTAKLRRQCKSAVAAAYVTDRYLQKKYPPSEYAITAAISEGDFPAAAYIARPRTTDCTRQATTLISVGSLEQMYKGIDTLIEALARLAAADAPLRLVHVGDGRYRSRLEQLASRLGVANNVAFTGTLPAGDAVRRQLDAADLFVLPSRTEGLPRALIEAMARGLPAISSTVGGIPEILPPEYLVAPDDAAGLAAMIRKLLADPLRMADASARNLARARDFSAHVLTPRRDAYYRAVRRATEQAPLFRFRRPPVSATEDVPDAIDTA